MNSNLFHNIEIYTRFQKKKNIYIFPFLIKKRLEHKNYVYLVHGFILQRFWKRMYIYTYCFFH